jgi:calcineurin-like phosphoesterase family protein
MKFFIADTHFFHEGILSYRNVLQQKRGLKEFRDVDYMNEYMIDQWNSVVRKEEDDVYHVGDLTFQPSRKRDEFLEIWSRLNGEKKSLNPGNHDSMIWMAKADLFKKIEYWSVFPKNGHLHIEGEYYTHGFFTHHAPLPAIEFRKTPWQVHGHTHQENMGDHSSPYICVCAEVNDYIPTSMDQIMVEIDRRLAAGNRGCIQYIGQREP